jgi:hypothetical protein
MFGICLLVALLYATLLYSVRKPVFSRKTNIFLFILRFIVVFLLSGLLLNPYIKGTDKRTEKPILLLAHDNSASVVINPDSVFYKQQYPDSYNQFIKVLSSRFQVEAYSFGSKLSLNAEPDFSEQTTDFGPVFKSLTNRYHRNNVAAMVLLSDGIYNSGINPLFLLSETFFPVYAVALGDTSLRPDLSIFDLRYNRVVTGRTDFPVEATIHVHMGQDQDIEARLFMNNRLMEKKRFRVTSDRFSISLNFLIRDAGPGTHKLRIETDTLPAEAVVLNNFRDFYVEVIDKKPKVLIMAASPHPDLGALVSALEASYEVEIMHERISKADEISPDILILHQLPAATNTSAVAVELLKNKPDLPVLLIPGSNTNLSTLNEMQSAFRIGSEQSAGIMEVYPSVNENFSLFGLNSALIARINQFPPLMVRFAGFQQAASSSNLINQRIRGVVMPQPLIAFSSDGERKAALISGTGIWRWRHYDFLQHGSHEAFNTLIGKTVNYLIVRDNRNPLRIQVSPEMPVNTDVRFDAELINKSLERINDPELSINVIHTETGLEYPYMFNRFGDGYQLNAGRFEEGLYRYTATASMPDGSVRAEGAFRIVASSFEARSVLADHGLMGQIAQATGGKMFSPENLMQLADELNKSEEFKSVVHFSDRFGPLVHWPFLLILIIVLLSAEWLLRKSSGSY